MLSGLVSLLGGESTITALVGSSPARIYVNKMPQGLNLPCIVLHKMSHDSNGTLDGNSNAFNFTAFDIDCKADRSVEAETLADAVQTFLDDYTGAAGSDTVRAVIQEDRITDYEPPADKSDVGIHVETLDVTIQWS